MNFIDKEVSPEPNECEPPSVSSTHAKNITNATINTIIDSTDTISKVAIILDIAPTHESVPDLNPAIAPIPLQLHEPVSIADREDDFIRLLSDFEKSWDALSDSDSVDSFPPDRNATPSVGEAFSDDDDDDLSSRLCNGIDVDNGFEVSPRALALSYDRLNSFCSSVESLAGHLDRGSRVPFVVVNKTTSYLSKRLFTLTDHQ